MKTSTPVLAAALAALVAAPLAAQSRPAFQHQFYETTPQTSGGFGDHAEGLGDVDFDGYDDYGVSAPNFDHGAGLGRVYVFSGRTGGLLVTFDNDVYASTYFGFSMANVGDVDLDGRAEIAVGAYDYNGAPGNKSGRVRCYDGATGAVLWTLDGEETFINLGRTMGAINDTDADGVRELVIGAPSKTTAAGPGAGKLYFVRGDTGVVYGFADGVVGFQGLGMALATRPETGLVYASTGLGDVYEIPLPAFGAVVPNLYLPRPAGVNDDASLALVNTGSAGSPKWSLAIGWWTADSGGFLNNGLVELRGGGLGASLSIAGTFSGEGVGRSVTHVFDQDGDGAEEVGFTSFPALFVTAYHVRSGTGAVLDDVVRGRGNLVISSLRDISGDGRGELVTAIDSGVSLQFECTVFSKGLEIASSGFDGPGNFDAGFDLDLGKANAGNGYLQVVGFSGSSPGFPNAQPGVPLVPLVPDAFTLMFLQALGSPITPNFLGVLDGPGRASTTMFLPASAVPALAGLELTTVAVAFDGAATLTAVTNPQRIEFPD